MSAKELLNGAAISTNNIDIPIDDTYITGCDLSKNASPNIDKCAEKYMHTIMKSQLSTNDCTSSLIPGLTSGCDHNSSTPANPCHNTAITSIINPATKNPIIANILSVEAIIYSLLDTSDLYFSLSFLLF